LDIFPFIGSGFLLLFFILSLSNEEKLTMHASPATAQEGIIAVKMSQFTLLGLYSSSEHWWPYDTIYRRI
jgi:hypothetical protein